LDSINLFDRTCPVNYVITIEALKEGWDCSFAYIFCSVANIRSAVDVEQLLGRVMRMPYARKRRIDELNKAYAHVISPSFAAAADSMYDRLVNMGFNAEEAAASIIQRPLLPGLDHDALPLFRAVQKEEPLLLELPAAPDIEHLPEEERRNITATQTDAGTFKVEYRGPGSDVVEEAVIAAAPGQKDEIRRKFAIRRARERQKKPPTPSQKGQMLTVGQLMLNLWDSLELPEAETILMAMDWSPLKHDVGMTPDEFRYNESARTFEFDLDGEKMRYHQADEQVRYTLLADATAWDERGLSRWLDRQCRQSDVRPGDMLEFCRRSVHSLLRLGSFDLEMLCRAKYALAAALKSKLAKLREHVLRDGYQLLFFSPERKVKMDLSKPHKFPLTGYAESCSEYTGAYAFKKHYYPVIHDLKSFGEEFECARALGMHSPVKTWVRNVDRQEGSFRLPLHNGWFYPDFVAELLDGRRLVVEYKGEHLIGTADTEEKQNIGELWAETGNGKHIFLMAVKKDTLGNTVDRQIAAVIAG
jgi:type III restriction enzyme